MSNRYPKFANFNNIIVRNNGNGKITSESICTDTIYVKNLVVTDNLSLPISNTDCLDECDINVLRINKEIKKISKKSGNLVYNSELEGVMIQKNGVMHDLVSRNESQNIESIQFEKTNNLDQTISNSLNKFNNISQTINFKGTQEPYSDSLILGSDNNINFLSDDSSFYLFSGFITASVKQPVFGQLGKKEFNSIDNNKIKLKRLKINYRTSIIKNGVIKIQEKDVSNYETIDLAKGVFNTSFKLKKLQIANKCYLSIVTKNLTDYYISWKANITLVKINVTPQKKIDNFDKFFHLNNKPESFMFSWDCYEPSEKKLIYKIKKSIDFYSIPIHNLSKKDGKKELNTLFFKTDNEKDINEMSTINDNISLLVRDITSNVDSLKPFAYKHSYYQNSKNNVFQKNSYILSKGFWKSREFGDKKFKQSEFFSIQYLDSKTNSINDYVYLTKSLIQGTDVYNDYYYLSINNKFKVNLVVDKIPEFKKSSFIDKNNKHKHYFIYKDIDKLSNNFRPIFISNKNVYEFNFGTINILEGKCVIIDSDPSSPTYKMSKSIQIFADFYIPTFQNIKTDIINKLTKDKLDPLEINKYLENAYLNKNFTNYKIIDLSSNIAFAPVDDKLNSYLKTVNTTPLFEDFSIRLSLGLRNIDLQNLAEVDYAILSKIINNKFNNFYLNIEVKSENEKSYQVNTLFENNIFDIFSI